MAAELGDDHHRPAAVEAFQLRLVVERRTKVIPQRHDASTLFGLHFKAQQQPDARLEVQYRVACVASALEMGGEQRCTDPPDLTRPAHPRKGQQETGFGLSQRLRPAAARGLPFRQSRAGTWVNLAGPAAPSLLAILRKLLSTFILRRSPLRARDLLLGQLNSRTG
jgi:hypothetical protein